MYIMVAVCTCTSASLALCCTERAARDSERGRLRQGTRGGGVAGEEGWQFPSLQHGDGDSLRETAERALLESVAPKNPDVWYTWTASNAPVGHLPSADNSQKTLFFFRWGSLDLPSNRVLLGAGCAPCGWARVPPLLAIELHGMCPKVERCYSYYS